ncbi:MAG: hypothetical protein K9G46_06310 [Flavobacteriales bacterium]|nr:hypothetical protein [Flavobacteriales bacterium]
MKTFITLLASILVLSFSSCDLNDTDDNGDFSLYFRTQMDGVLWNASVTRARFDNNGIDPYVHIEGDGAATSGEYFSISIPPMVASDTTISGAGLAGVISFTQNLNVWTSTTGTLTIHEDHFQGGSGTKHEYTGTFSGTLVNTSNGTSKTLASGEFLVQGIFN